MFFFKTVLGKLDILCIETVRLGSLAWPGHLRTVLCTAAPPPAGIYSHHHYLKHHTYTVHDVNLWGRLYAPSNPPGESSIIFPRDVTYDYILWPMLCRMPVPLHDVHNRLSSPSLL